MMNVQRVYWMAVFACTFGAGSGCMTGDQNPYYAVVDASTASSEDAADDGAASDATDTSVDAARLGDFAFAPTGVGDCVGFSDTDMPLAKTDRTVEAWVKTTFMGEGYAFSYGPIVSGAGFFLGLSGGKPSVTQIGDSLSAATSVADGRWHHIAVVYTGSNSEYSLFTDGEPDGKKVMSTNTLKDGKAAVSMCSPSGKPLFGAIDEVRVWKVARSAADIKADMAKQLTGAEPPLVAWFSMNDLGGSGAGISVPNRATAATARLGTTEGTTGTFVPGLTTP